MSRDFIQKAARVQPGGGERDIITLSKRVEELSHQISSDERPQLSALFLEAPLGGSSGDTIDLVTGQTNLVKHGLGREYRGWYLATLYDSAIVYEPDADELDAAGEIVDYNVFLPLKCSANCTVKLVIF